MKAHEYLKNHTKREIDASEFEDIAGEKIQEWIGANSNFSLGLCRKPTEEDLQDFDFAIAWVFTNKGQRLYDSYLSKVTRLAEKLFPDAIYFEIENKTGIITA